MGQKTKPQTRFSQAAKWKAEADVIILKPAVLKAVQSTRALYSGVGEKTAIYLHSADAACAQARWSPTSCTLDWRTKSTQQPA